MPLTPPGPGALGSIDPASGLVITGGAADIIGDESLLEDRCEIHRAAKASDGQGGRRFTWSAVATDVACSIQFGNSASQQQMPTPKETSVGGKMRAVEIWSARFGRTRDVRAQDRIVKGAYTWEVLDVSGGETSEVWRHAVLTRIGPQGA